MSRLLARLILLPVGLAHVAICLVVLWLDEQSLSSYLDGIVKARRELDKFPLLLVVDSKVCRKGTVLITEKGECLARLETETEGRLHWVGLSAKVATNDRALILRQSDIDEPLRITKEQT